MFGMNSLSVFFCITCGSFSTHTKMPVHSLATPAICNLEYIHPLKKKSYIVFLKIWGVQNLGGWNTVWLCLLGWPGTRNHSPASVLQVWRFVSPHTLLSLNSYPDPYLGSLNARLSSFFWSHTGVSPSARQTCNHTVGVTGVSPSAGQIGHHTVGVTMAEGPWAPLLKGGRDNLALAP